MKKIKFRVRWDVVAGVGGAMAGALLAAVALSNDTHTLPPRTITIQPVAVVPAPPPVDPPPAEPSKATPTLMEAADASISGRENALARELSTMWTRNPDELVHVIDDASRAAPVSPSVTLLLAIAHAETNGKILDVSEAGAVGLAQATPTGSCSSPPTTRSAPEPTSSRSPSAMPIASPRWFSITTATRRR